MAAKDLDGEWVRPQKAEPDYVVVAWALWLRLRVHKAIGHSFCELYFYLKLDIHS
jgi:hypothetical protein